MNSILILIIYLLTTFPNTTNADIYKWTDEHGDIHFSNNENSLPESAQKIIENADPVKPKVQVISPSPKTYIPQIPGKTKEQQEKELNEQVKRVKEQSKKDIDEMFSVANEGLISIRNGLIVLFVSMISLQLLKKFIRQKSE